MTTPDHLAVRHTFTSPMIAERVTRRLDRTSFRRVVEALEISRGEPPEHEREALGAAA